MYPNLEYFNESYTGDYSEVELPITNADLEKIYPIASAKSKEDESYLEEALPDSELSNEIIERFEKIHQLHRKFEDFTISYDSLFEEFNNSDPRNIIKSIYEKLLGISDIPHITNIESIQDREIEEIKNWINSKCEIASKISEDDTLPDTLNYGESIIIKGVDDSKLSFTIDEIEITVQLLNLIEIIPINKFL